MGCERLRGNITDEGVVKITVITVLELAVCLLIIDVCMYLVVFYRGCGILNYIPCARGIRDVCPLFVLLLHSGILCAAGLIKVNLLTCDTNSKDQQDSLS